MRSAATKGDDTSDPAHLASIVETLPYHRGIVEYLEKGTEAAPAVGAAPTAAPGDPMAPVAPSAPEILIREKLGKGYQEVQSG